jgi:hypothetical protein
MCKENGLMTKKENKNRGGIDVEEEYAEKITNTTEIQETI